MSAERLLPLVEAVAEQLRAAGIDASSGLGQGTLEPFDEAAWLVLWALGLPMDTDLQTEANRGLSADDVQRAQALVQRRITERRPTAYLTGQAWLCGIAFHVDERAIIPRSFIAELMVDATLDGWLGDHTQRVLDLCTGNGSLAVIAALTYPEVHVDAADISAQALEVARINVEQHGLSERIRVRSIVDRFLEHARIWYFENAQRPEVFVGSAAWMPRNLHRRIEVVFPIEDGRLRERITTGILDIELADNSKARQLQPDGTYVIPGLGPKVRPRRAQGEFMSRVGSDRKASSRTPEITKPAKLVPRTRPG